MNDRFHFVAPNRETCFPRYDLTVFVSLVAICHCQGNLSRALWYCARRNPTNGVSHINIVELAVVRFGSLISVRRSNGLAMRSGWWRG